MIAVESHPICYPFSITNEILNLPSSKKRTNSTRSNLMKFSYWIYWSFLVEQQIFIQSWRPTKFQKQKDSSPTNGLVTLTKCRLQNLCHLTTFAVNFIGRTLLKLNARTTLTSWSLDWPQNKPSSDENYRSHPYWDWKLPVLANKYGSRNNWSQSKTFCDDIKKR